MGASLEVPVPSALAGHVALSDARFSAAYCGQPSPAPDDPASAFVVPRRANVPLEPSAPAVFRFITAVSPVTATAVPGPPGSDPRVNKRAIVAWSGYRPDGAHGVLSALRRLDPVRRSGGCFHHRIPTCRSSERPPRSCLFSGDRPLISYSTLLFKARPITDVPIRLLGSHLRAVRH